MNKEKKELIKKRNELIDSFFFIFSKKKKKLLKEIDEELDKIEMAESEPDHVKLQSQINQMHENSKRLNELLKKL